MTGPDDETPPDQTEAEPNATPSEPVPIGYAPSAAFDDGVGLSPEAPPTGPPRVKKRSKLLWTFLIIVIVIVSMALGAILFGGSSSQRGNRGGPGGSGRSGAAGSGVRVDFGPIQKTIEVDGSIQPVSTYSLTFPTPSSDVVVGPRIKSINTTVGQRVQTGWLLAQLEGDDVDAAKIFAPIDGVVTDIKGVAGAPPPSGATILMRSNDLQGQFPLSEADLAGLKPETEATVTIPVLSRSIGTRITTLPEDPVAQSSTSSSSSSSSGSSSSSSSTTYNLLVPLPPVGGMRPGLTARIAAVTYSNPQALLIPNAAVVVDGTGTWVQLIREGGPPQRRDVRVGVSDGRRTEVLEGLKAGDQVVVRQQNTQGG